MLPTLRQDGLSSSGQINALTPSIYIATSRLKAMSLSEYQEAMYGHDKGTGNDKHRSFRALGRGMIFLNKLVEPLAS